jgi:hypothetical protein
VLVSNLGLTVFVNLVKQIPQPALREKKRKHLKSRDLMVFSVFAPYQSKSLQMLPLFS